MSLSDFRHITGRGDASKGERLFRAAIAAFCSLTRPTRREIAQLDDLALPLFDGVSTDSKRYVAAVLSECRRAPEGLVRRLCDESVDIAAPLLMRSTVLTDVDLIALIGRHGAGHARAIGRRANLHPTIAELVASLERKAATPRLAASLAVPEPAAAAAVVPPEPVPAGPAEAVRERLRDMMVPAAEPAVSYLSATPSAYVRLRDTALTGHLAFFQTALADALDVDFPTAREVTAGSSYTALAMALRALGLGEEQAYVVTAAVYPSLFPHPEAIRQFLARYRALHRDAAAEKVAMLRLDGLAARVERNPAPRRPAGLAAANADTPGTVQPLLRARGPR